MKYYKVKEKWLVEVWTYVQAESLESAQDEIERGEISLPSVWNKYIDIFECDDHDVLDQFKRLVIAKLNT